MKYQRRIKREFYGVTRRIPACEAGALAQCHFCTWGRFFPDRKRKRYSAVARAAASLREHATRMHKDKFPQFSNAAEIFGEKGSASGCADVSDLY